MKKFAVTIIGGLILFPTITLATPLTKLQADSLISVVQSSPGIPASAFTGLITAFSNVTTAQAKSLIGVIQASPTAPASAFESLLFAFTQGAQPATGASSVTTPTPDWSAYETLPSDFIKNPPAYIGIDVKVGGSVVDFLAKGDRGGASNYIELVAASNDSLNGQKIMLEIDSDSQYALAASTLNQLSGVVAYGTVQASSQFTTAAGGVIDVPVISITRLDTCGLMMCPVTPNASYSTTTIFPANASVASRGTQAAASAPAPTCSLSFDQSSVSNGSPATLSWTTANATSLSIDHNVGDVTPVSSGSTSVTPSVSTTYDGEVAGPGGNSACEANIAVTAPTWHQVYVASGTTNTNTAQFVLQGTKQQITYSCSVLDSSIPINGFDGMIQATQGYSGDAFANGVTCPSSGSTYEYDLSPGSYYLSLGPTNARYSISVEDYY